MCDCCKAEGRDYQFTTGSSKLKSARFYKVYVGRVAGIKLCRLCDIELFHVGENRFLRNHIDFAKNLSSSKSSSID